MVVDLWGGWRDAAGTQRWQRDTLVNVFSVGKAVAAVCVARLVGQGRLGFDQPVAAVWPEFAAAGKQDITVRQLLSHQAGLPALRAEVAAGSVYDWDAMCARLAAEEPWWPPGTAARLPRQHLRVLGGRAGAPGHRPLPRHHGPP